MRFGPILLGIGVVAGLGALGWFWMGRSGDADGTRHASAGDPLNATFSTLAAPNEGGTSKTATEPSPGGANPQAAAPPPAAPISVIDMSKGVQRDPSSSVATETNGTNPGTPGVNPATASNAQPTGAPGTPEAAPTQTNPTAGAPAVAPAPSATPGSAASPAVAEADRLIATNRLVEARTLLNSALGAATPETAASVRDRLGALNQTLLFSPTVFPGDPICLSYAVQPRDSLAKIVASQGLQVDWRLLQRVNGMSNPGRLNIGQKLKLVRGPFHAVVSKSDYRLDLYWGDTASPGERVFIRSFRVGLGENNSTPIGAFVVRPSSKLINPEWANPRTGEKFGADNPMNPIGEFWIGLDPAEAATAVHTQYGLHGTIEPESIGQQKSMGCVRLAPDDIALLYELLMDRVSHVRIDP